MQYARDNNTGELVYLSTAVDVDNPTQAEQDAAMPAVLADIEAKTQRQLAKEAIYAPFTYLGVQYGMTPDRTNVYDSLMGKNSRGKAAKSVVEALDGSFTKFGTPTALKAFLDAVDDELDLRLATAHDNL